MVKENYILILSDEDDISTNDVIDWLDYYGFPVLRINESTKVYCNYFVISDNGNVNWSITIGGREYSNEQILSYWYRRGVLVFEYKFIKSDNLPLAAMKLNTYLNHENTGVFKLFNSYLNSITNKIGNIGDNYLSKGNVLQIAKQCGLRVPETIITSRKQDLEVFIAKHDFVITKAISEGVAAEIDDDFKINGFTTMVNQSALEETPDFFFPTLFQEGLNKKWEIRSFYLNEDIYSSAIFSQKDESTKIDFRHYGKIYPNRTPPYDLPIVIKDAIIKLMRRLKMQSGSLDFVFTDKGEYVFLEVNPVGQFAQVSDPCNFYLEEKIAKQLIYDRGKS